MPTAGVLSATSTNVAADAICVEADLVKVDEYTVSNAATRRWRLGEVPLPGGVAAAPARNRDGVQPLRPMETRSALSRITSFFVYLFERVMPDPFVFVILTVLARFSAKRW